MNLDLTKFLILLALLAIHCHQFLTGVASWKMKQKIPCHVFPPPGPFFHHLKCHHKLFVFLFLCLTPLLDILFCFEFYIKLVLMSCAIKPLSFKFFLSHQMLFPVFDKYPLEFCSVLSKKHQCISF